MSKEDKNTKQNVINQLAFILNYQPNIEHQHNYMGNPAGKDESATEDAEFEEVKQEAPSCHEEQQKPPEEQQTPLNYYAPTKNLQVLLKQEWFKKHRTKEEYDEVWTDNFVNSLMSSEWKDGIARDWSAGGKRRKVNQIKGFVIGLLADNGVLKGSYDSIAKTVGIDKGSRTFSRYMGMGKKQPYAEWVQQYVSGKIE